MDVVVSKHSLRKGFFLVLEGGEGVGKTTNLQFIQQTLEQFQIAFQSSREPGGTPLAESIRALVLEKHAEPVSAVAELMLVFAARAQHLQEKIIPILDRGEWLLCDRFTDATYAYQGGGRQLDKAVIAQLEAIVQGSLRPDCVIVLDAPVHIGQSRARQRADLDRMESENLQFHQRVRDAYLQRASENPSTYSVIDASLPLEKVQQQIKQVLMALIAKWNADT